MALLDFLRPQQAQVPGQQSPFQNLLAPEVALPMAAMLMGGQGNAANLGNAFMAGGQALGQQKELQAQTAKENQTADWLRTQGPQYAQMLDGGLAAGDVYKLYIQDRSAKPTRNEFAERSAAAQQYGLEGDDATSFVLTGQLPTGRFGSAEVGLQPIPVINEETGQVELYQPTKSGTPVQMKFPEGYRPMAPFERGFDTAAGRTAGEVSGAAAGALPAATVTAQRVETQVNDLKNDPYLPRMLGPIDSVLPNVTQDAARVQSKILQLQGGAFLEARQLLKGGGAITDYEGQKAEQAFARLNQAQSVEDFQKALDEFNFYVQQGLQKLQLQAGQGARRQTGYAPPSPAAAPTGQRYRFNPATGELE